MAEFAYPMTFDPQDVPGLAGAVPQGMTTNDGMNYPMTFTPQDAQQGVQGTLVDQLLHGIAQRETGGARDPYGNITNAGGGRNVYGKYQVLGANIPAWTKEALGTPLTPAQFLASPEAQEATVRYKLGQYVNQYGPEGAAQAWLGGPGSVGKTDRADRFGTTVGQYGRDVMAYAGLSGRQNPGLDAIDSFIAQHHPNAQGQPPQVPPTPGGPDLGLVDSFINTNRQQVNQATSDDSADYNGAVPQQAAPQQQYVKLPDGSYVAFPHDMGDDQIAAVLKGMQTTPPAQNAPAAAVAPPQVPPQQGNWADAIAGGANALLGGIPNMVNAGVRELTGNGMPGGYNDTLAALGQAQETAAAAHPVLNAAGMALGAVPAGMAALATPEIPGLAGASLIPRVAGRIAQGAALGTAAGAGQGYSTTGTGEGALKGGLAGGAGGAALGVLSPIAVPVAGAALGGYAGYKASGGSVAGTLGGAVAGAAGAKALGEVAAPLVTKALGVTPGPERKGFDALAALMRQPGETASSVAARVRADFDAFRQTFGYNPSAAQLMEQEQARNLAAKIDGAPQAQEIARNAEQAASDRLQSAVKVNVEGAHNPTTETGLASQAKREMTAAMDAPGAAGVPVRETPVPTSDPVFLAKPYELIDSALGRNSTDAQTLEQAIADGKPVPLRIVDLARERLAAGKGVSPGDEQTARATAEKLLQLGRQASPEYSAAYDQYADTMRRAAGAGVGAGGVTAGPENFTADIANLQDQSGARAATATAGVGPGLRTQLAEQATQGPAGAARVATQITGNENLRRNMAASLPPAEVARIQNVAQIAKKAGTAMSELAVTGKPQAEIDRGAADYAARAAAYGVMGHHFGMMHSIANFVKRFGLGAGETKRLAMLATDPSKTRAIVNYLQQRGMGRADAVETARRLAAVAAGGVAAQQVTP